ncbi:hypothetical protein EIN_419350 [Entamoeba invadens IP1]|uniref:Uncharacterized protein n=1 Tax=Entamoeba invadens IP1 TaxID=370355 RepID=A0A0A1U1W0_ENTIV|nr:hypothetical protein EIN_419350 [Entamoeba invadens IP1]ELP88006.1 hypothetical protein EIN_419350 [Entamoeba invadens IP1]|eukprot:XP_004254777.1 hypothetical protein EIN_419350 [Entamoeba invadens IP1]
MSLTFQCACCNIRINSVRREKSAEDGLPVTEDKVVEWLTGSVTVKYTFLTQSHKSGKWNILKCLNCKSNFLAMKNDDSKTILLLDNSTDSIQNKHFSTTYGIFLDTSGELVEGFVDEEERKEIAKIRKERVDALYKLKEQKIADYVKRLEEKFDSEKAEIEHEEKAMLSSCAVNLIEANVNEKEDESYFAYDEENPFGVSSDRVDVANESTTEVKSEVLHLNDLDEMPQQEKMKEMPGKLHNALKREVAMKQAQKKPQNVTEANNHGNTKSLGFLEMMKSTEQIKIARSFTGGEGFGDDSNEFFPKTFQEYTLNQKEVSDVPISSSHIKCFKNNY